jgi:hypothetical protein
MKRTKKYVEAVKVAKCGLMDWENQREMLYEVLQSNGYMWDSKAGEWLHLPSMEADDPSPLIKVRVWAERGGVETEATQIVKFYQEKGYTLVEKSKVLPCRPPKQKEGRVYLYFLNK